MKNVTIFLFVVSVVSALAITTPDAQRGRDAFEKTCTGCHTLDRVKVGPPLRDVYGRPAGRNRQFSYSDAMKAASFTWDGETLDRWLADTESVVPDNDMSFRLNDAAKRADIIAYLKQLSGR